MNIKDVLFTLADTPGVSGNETRRALICAEYLKKYTSDVRFDGINVIADIGKRTETGRHILLDAHTDQVGMVCTYITCGGFIKIGNVGGLDRRLLLGQEVTVLGKKDIPGVIALLPPHLNKGDKKPPEFEDIYIDTGYSKEKLENIVCPGDCISFNTKCRELLDGRVTGSSFDDCAGIAAILYALDLIKEQPVKNSISVLFSAQEETGGRGAKTAAYEINPDIAVAVDVSFAFSKGEAEEKCGEMGGGAMIGISPSISREVSDLFIKTAADNNIPYQLEVMPGLTSTNADHFAITRSGVKAAVISIPIKYMHTPVEVLQLSDIVNTARLIAKFISSL